jgi:hypothetical protein
VKWLMIMIILKCKYIPIYMHDTTKAWIAQLVKQLSYEMYDRGSIPRRRWDSVLPTTSGSAVGTNEPPIQWVSADVYPGVNWTLREAQHSPPLPHTPSWRDA